MSTSITKKYIQTKNLQAVFDLSEDYFVKRIGIELFEGVHFFRPPSTSPTKKAVLWDISALDNWIRGHKVDDELEDLLSRSKKR